MYLGSKLLPQDASWNDEANNSINQSNDTLQGRTVEDNIFGGGGRSFWRRKESADTTSRGSVPLAPMEEGPPQQSTARLIDTTKIRSSVPVTQNTIAPNGEGNPEMDATQHLDPRKVVVTIPEELLANLRSKCDSKASVSLLGRIQGKHPGLQALTAWAKENLHPSLKLLSLKANNIFEVTFDQLEGRIHALNQADLMCESAAIFLSSWRPHFDASGS